MSKGDGEVKNLEDSGTELQNLAPGPKGVREEKVPVGAPSGSKPMLVQCNTCKADITRWCMIALMPTMTPTGPGMMPLVLQPGRCPKCGIALFFSAPSSGIVIPEKRVAPPNLKQ